MQLAVSHIVLTYYYYVSQSTKFQQGRGVSLSNPKILVLLLFQKYYFIIFRHSWTGMINISRKEIWILWHKHTHTHTHTNTHTHTHTHNIYIDTYNKEKKRKKIIIVKRRQYHPPSPRKKRTPATPQTEVPTATVKE